MISSDRANMSMPTPWHKRFLGKDSPLLLLLVVSISHKLSYITYYISTSDDTHWAAAGIGYVFRDNLTRMPLYYLIIEIFGRFFGQGHGEGMILAGAVLNVLFSTAALIALYYLAYGILNSRISAWFIAAITLWSGLHVYHSTQALGDMLLILLYILTAYALISGKGGWAYVAAVAAFLSRQDGALLLLIVPAWLFLGHDRKRSLRLLMASAFLIFLWGVFNFYQPKNYLDLMFAKEQFAPSERAMGWNFSSLVSINVRALDGFIHLPTNALFYRTRLAFQPLLTASLWALFVLGMVDIYRRRKNAFAIFLLTMSGYIAFMTLVFKIFLPKYVLPISWIFTIAVLQGAMVLSGMIHNWYLKGESEGSMLRLLGLFGGALASFVVAMFFFEKMGYSSDIQSRRVFLILYIICGSFALWPLVANRWPGVRFWSALALVGFLAGNGMLGIGRYLLDHKLGPRPARTLGAEWLKKNGMPGETVAVIDWWAARLMGTNIRGVEHQRLVNIWKNITPGEAGAWLSAKRPTYLAIFHPCTYRDPCGVNEYLKRHQAGFKEVYSRSIREEWKSVDFKVFRYYPEKVLASAGPKPKPPPPPGTERFRVPRVPFE